MKDRSKEKIAELLMDELMTALTERGNVRRMLGEMTGIPISRLVNDMIVEFERVVEEYYNRNLNTVPTAATAAEVQQGEPFTPTPSLSTPLPVVSDEPDSPEPAPAEAESTGTPTDEVVRLMKDEKGKKEKPPVVAETNSEEVEEPPTEAASEEQPAPPKKDVTDFRQRLEELARRVENEYLEKLQKTRPKKKETEKKPEPPAEAPAAEPKRIIDVTPGVLGKPSRVPYRIDDHDYVYVHGVMMIPGEEAPSEQPFMLEEKGIDGKEFAFAIDVDRLRFFLSKINQNEMNVSRKGLLLLGKSESLQLRGMHESILNELRGHGIVLPMEFGTVAKGKTDLAGLAERFRTDIEEGIERLAGSSWWTLDMFILDGRIAQLFASEEEGKPERAGRERARVSYSAALQPKKYDVKLLEKILQKEKRLAESVHQELTAVVQRSEVQSMVGLGSGSSDEWKLILKATYHVPPSEYQKFARTVTDLQYRHILFEPMLAITGDREAFSFLKK